VPLFSHFYGAQPHFCYFFCEEKVGPAGRRPSGSERPKAQLSQKHNVHDNGKATPQAKRTATKEPKKAQLSTLYLDNYICYTFKKFIQTISVSVTMFQT